MATNAASAAVRSCLLSQISDRMVCRVSQFDLLPEDESRLKNMGVCVGRLIELLQVGDPLIVKVSGANIGVSRRLAGGIRVSLGAERPRDASQRQSSDSIETPLQTPLQTAAIA